jgi:hypothetical protein
MNKIDVCKISNPKQKSVSLRYRFILTLISTASLSVLPSLWVRAYANGIFTPAKNELTCIIKSASSGAGATNTIITSLPLVIFTTIALFLFAYFLGSVFQLVQGMRAGEESSQLIIPILAAIIGVIIIMIFQNILFGAGGGC